MRQKWIVGGLCFLAGCQSLSARKASTAAVPIVPAVPAPKLAAPAETAPTATNVRLIPPPTTKPETEPVKPVPASVPIVPAVPVKRTQLPENGKLDHLMQAAECLENNDTPAALEHLRKHVLQHPDQGMIRAYLAELLFKAGQFEESKFQFERFVADAQRIPGPLNNHLLHCHTRLMEMAEEKDEAYAEHLNRGIGLFLLAQQTAGQTHIADDEMPQKLLLKATTELNLAAKLSPQEARPHWYAYKCWTKLEQPEPSTAALKIAKEKREQPDLTPHEREELKAVP
jgi:tetratricopeptide (TPR) repeat protein